MRISKIQVHGLFGMFDHDIPLKLRDRITIIHGPNGVGKTTLLKLVHDLFREHYHALSRVPFDNLTITFDNRTNLAVRRRLTKPAKGPSEVELALLYKGRGKADKHEIKVRALRRRASSLRGLAMIDDIVPHLQRIDQEQWIDQRTGIALDLPDVLDRYAHILPDSFYSREELPKTFRRVMETVPTHFIQTQRLFSTEDLDLRRRPHRSDSGSTVERYSIEMAQQIQTRLKESGSRAASLDRTFPHRLIGHALPHDVTEERIRSEYKRQADYRVRLMSAGLIEPEEQLPLPESKIDDNERKVLWYYLQDVAEKFKVFDKLLRRVELFKDIINTRFLYKSFTIDKDDGFKFVAEDSSTVPLRSLSSGEQHELVLAFELLFKVEEDAMILIDEPELSLHVTWQHKFLEDLRRISELANLDFLIATHSPSIIHDRQDLMVPLGDRD